jgi:signal transduction histidine kinase
LTDGAPARAATGWLLLLVSVLSCDQLARSQGDLPAAPTLVTNIQQVVSMDPSLLASRPEARVRGVITYVSNLARRFYVQADTNALQVNVAGPVTDYHVGQYVEVTGGIHANLRVRYLVNAGVTVLGEAPLPEATFISAHRLAAGDAAFRLMATRGIVRDMVSGPTGPTFLCTYEGLFFELTVPTNSIPLPREWLDAEIEARGIGFPFFNTYGRATTFRFHPPGMDSIRVIKPGAGTLFERPLMTIAEVARHAEQWEARYRIAGTVTIQRPDGVLYLSDETGVMLVMLQSLLSKPTGGHGLEHEPQTWLQPGERIEVIGARHNLYSLTPTLVFAEFRRIGQGALPAARAVSIRDLQKGRHAGKLVSLEARLLNHRGWANAAGSHEAFTFQAGETVFQASWDSETPADWDLKPYSFVRVTGVSEAEGGKFKSRPTFQLLLRSPADIVPAAAPAFWTRPQVWKPSLAAAAVAIVAIGWILLQRWQMGRLEGRVADRTADLRSANEQLKEEVAGRERAETEVQRALAQEKQLSELKSRFVSMVSHEFRTPLGIIAGSAEILDAYLERLSPEERKSNIRDITDATRHMARMMEEVLLLGRVEAGKMTCRPGPLDLAVFGRRLTDEVISATNGRCPIEFMPAAGLVEAQADENLLRHIFTNLLNNASKYSAPGSTVEFRIEPRGHLAIFTVRDFGIGIPEADVKNLFQAFHRGSNVGDAPGTGLGMTIVKRCVELHAGRIAFESKEGSGTTFIVALPLFGAPDVNGQGGTRFLQAVVGKNITVIS